MGVIPKSQPEEPRHPGPKAAAMMMTVAPTVVGGGGGGARCWCVMHYSLHSPNPVTVTQPRWCSPLRGFSLDCRSQRSQGSIAPRRQDAVINGRVLEPYAVGLAACTSRFGQR